MQNIDQPPSREWPVGLNESRNDNQRWKRNMHSQEDVRSENSKYNSPPRGGPINTFDDHRKKKSLLPLPDPEIEHLNLERDSNHPRNKK